MSILPRTAVLPPSPAAIPGLWRGDQLACSGLPGIPTGFERLDHELPGGGWPLGALTELLADRSGIGELRLLFPAFAQLTRAGQALFLVTSPALAPLPVLPNAPALAAAGIDLAHTTVVRPASEAEILWTLEQVLRSGVRGAAVAWLEQVTPAQLRRLQLAAENQPIAMMLFRPVHAAAHASPAPLRIRLATRGFTLEAHFIKRRGAPCAAPIPIDLPQPARFVHHESTPPVGSADPAAPADRPADARESRRIAA